MIKKVVKIRNRKTGRTRYLSVEHNEQRKQQQRKSQGVDWADWKPKHRLGVFANLAIRRFKHNRKEIIE